MGVPIRLAADYDNSLRYALPVEVRGAYPFQILAIWMLKEPIHYVPNLVAILEHYRPFLERAPTVILGDFNANRVFDKKHPRYVFDSIAGALDSLGLVSAYHSFTGETFGAESQPTFYFRYHQHEPFHIDYLFFPQSWSSSLNAVTVGNFSDYAGLSDHRPLTAQFHLEGAAGTAQQKASPFGARLELKD
jgi:exodeoxyribonuclease-3